MVKQHLGFPDGSVVKNTPASAGDSRDTGSIPGSGRSPERGHGNLLQYSCLENPMDRGTWSATVHGVGLKESDTIEHAQEKSGMNFSANPKHLLH